MNGEAITKAEFEQHIAQMEMAAGQQVPKEQRNEIYRKALDQLINVKLLKNEVKARKLRGRREDRRRADAEGQEPVPL